MRRTTESAGRAQPRSRAEPTNGAHLLWPLRALPLCLANCASSCCTSQSMQDQKPEECSEHNRTEEGDPTAQLRGSAFKPTACVPHQMTDSAKQVVEECVGE